MAEPRWSRITLAELLPELADNDGVSAAPAEQVDTPVYDRLVAEWRQQGRTPPGDRP